MELPGLRTRHNLDALDIAGMFDDAAWRETAIDAIARALDTLTSRGPGRVALPAVLGLQDHPAVMDALRRKLPLVPFEVPLVPPSVPGVRLYRALRAALRGRGGRILVGEPILRVERDGSRVTVVATAAAVRERVPHRRRDPGHPAGSPAVVWLRDRTAGWRSRSLACRSRRHMPMPGWLPTRSTRPATRWRQPAFGWTATFGRRGLPAERRPWRTCASSAACWQGSATSASDAATAWRWRAAGGRP